MDARGMSHWERAVLREWWDRQCAKAGGDLPDDEEQ